MQHTRKSPVAIVGISAQLPSGADASKNLDYTTFWNFLLQKGQAYEKIPEDRFSSERWHGGALGQCVTQTGCFLKDITNFDHLEFGISHKDAKNMSPSTRRLIELAFLALLDAGIDSRGKSIGCFMCGTNPELLDQDEFDAQGSFGNYPSMMANRVSYALDITGPSLTLDTACSSSLTALHLAIQSIESGECCAALVGGSQYNHRLWDWLNYSQGGVLSSDGTSKPFDANANGFARGEGAAVIVLKPLDAALRDNDHVYATVIGSAINSTGSSAPLHTPSGSSQQKCIRSVYAQAGRLPSDADYVELHATGTSVGDPIETNAAGEVFSCSQEVLIGSVKGNIGHLEAAAFLASLIKCCLIFQHGTIPPNVNVNAPNPNIHWERYGLRVPTEPVALGCRSGSGKSLISVMSSGIGGSNGHVLLEAPPNKRRQSNSFDDITNQLVRPLIVGGLSSQAAAEILDKVSKDILSLDPSQISGVIVTHARRARQLPWRTFSTVQTGTFSSPTTPALVSNPPPPLVLVFSGQGPQHIDMGRQLFKVHKTFRQSILDMDRMHKEFSGVSLIETTGLFQDSDLGQKRLPEVWSVAVTLPALCMLQMALFDLLVSVGVIPDAVIGHSAGETAVVYASGAGSKAMALEIAIARGKSMSTTECLGGSMAAVGCGLKQAQGLIERVGNSDNNQCIQIACHNASDSTTVSGSTELVDKLLQVAQADNIFARKIRTRMPGHSRMMDACYLEYSAAMSDIFMRYGGPISPSIPVYSTVTGDLLSGPFTPEYFWENARKPVLFNEALSVLQLKMPTSIFVEISPHPSLSSSILSIGGPNTTTFCPLRRPSNKDSTRPGSQETMAFSEALGKLVVQGINSLDLTALYGNSSTENATNAPEYPFIARHIPFRADRSKFGDEVQSLSGPLCSPHLRINKRTHPVLSEHVIKGEPIMPAAGFIEMALEAGAQLLWSVEFTSFLSLTAQNPLAIRFKLDNQRWFVESASGNDGDDYNALKKNPWSVRLHAQGSMSRVGLTAEASLDLESLWRALPSLRLEGFYESLQSFADFGHSFRRAKRLAGGPEEVLVEVKGLTENESSERYRFHPAILDACIHVVLHPRVVDEPNADAFYLPSKVGELAVFVESFPRGSSIFSHVILRHWAPESRVYDVTIVDHSGAPLCSMKGFELKRHLNRPPVAIARRFDFVYQPIKIPLRPVQSEVNFRRNDRLEAQRLFNSLDFMALEMIRSSLRNDPLVGEEVHRRRYFQFAERSALKTLSLPKDSESLRGQWPVYFEVTERLRLVHRDVFASSKVAVEALYSDDLMSRFYNANGHFVSICKEATRAFGDVLNSIVDEGKRAVRVLEVGTGTGLLTNHLTELLKTRADVVVHYTASDVSFALANDVAQESSYGFIFPKAFDVTKPPEDQGLIPGTYDIITALHVLHATADVSEVLNALRRLLVPGGTLLVVELDGGSWPDSPGALWHDCVFGSFSGWLSYTDSRSHCTMTPHAWRDALRASDYTNIQLHTEEGGGLDFLFRAQAPDMIPASTRSLPPNHILEFCRGEEMELQARIGELDTGCHLAVWLVAAEGPDGDAALGLIATLSRELKSWDVYLGIFHSSWSSKHYSDLICNSVYYTAGGDNIIYFDETGKPHVPRVLPSVAPPETRDFDTRNTWIESEGQILQSRLPALEEDRVAVHVIAWSQMQSSLTGFIGRILENGDTDLTIGDLVVGIHESGRASDIVVHSGQVSSLPVLPEPNRIAGLALAMVVGTLALGPTFSVISRKRAVRSRFLFVKYDNDLDQAILHFLRNCGASVDVDVVSIEECSHSEYQGQFNTIIINSTTQAANPHIRSRLARQGKLFVWDDVIRQELAENPWSIGCALNLGMWFTSTPLSHQPATVTPEALVCDLHGKRVQDVMSIFDSRKAYILLGGIGGLGIGVALWMYKNGARSIVLTSRHGIASLDATTDSSSLRTLSYLENLADLDLRLEASDATDALALDRLIRSISIPIGGCILMPLVLSDRLFPHLTKGDFDVVYKSKTGAFEALAHAVSIESLDFLVVFSSIAGLLGNEGQANYSSACTALNAVIRPYRNAFSFIVPGVSDAGYIIRRGENALSLEGGNDWFLTLDELCAYLGDGIRKLSNTTDSFSQYIPDLRWNMVESHMGLPPNCRHLISFNKSRSDIQTEDFGIDGLLNVMLGILDVKKEEFSPDVPLTAFGLDSLSAARAAVAIRPYAAISQLQLLSDMTWNQVTAKFNPTTSANGSAITTNGHSPETNGHSPETNGHSPETNGHSPETNGHSPETNGHSPETNGHSPETNGHSSKTNGHSPKNLSKHTETTVVELRGGDGVPLVLIHGAEGGINVFLPLKDKFHSPLWAIRITDETPMSSLAAMADFYHKKLKEKRPTGPYRIAAFSASSIIGVALVLLLESHGDEVSQLAFIDHFPTLFTCPTYDPTRFVDDDGKVTQYMIDKAVDSMQEMLSRDKTGPESDQLAEDMVKAYHGLPSTNFARYFVASIRLLVNFFSECSQGDLPHFSEPLARWVEQLKAPITVYVASQGIITSLPMKLQAEWSDLGAKASMPEAKIYTVAGGHYEVLKDDLVVETLQLGWQGRGQRETTFSDLQL